MNKNIDELKNNFYLAINYKLSNAYVLEKILSIIQIMEAINLKRFKYKGKSNLEMDEVLSENLLKNENDKVKKILNNILYDKISNYKNFIKIPSSEIKLNIFKKNGGMYWLVNNNDSYTKEDVLEAVSEGCFHRIDKLKKPYNTDMDIIEALLRSSRIDIKKTEINNEFCASGENGSYLLLRSLRKIDKNIFNDIELFLYLMEINPEILSYRVNPMINDKEFMFSLLSKIIEDKIVITNQEFQLLCYIPKEIKKNDELSKKYLLKLKEIKNLCPDGISFNYYHILSRKVLGSESMSKFVIEKILSITDDMELQSIEKNVTVKNTKFFKILKEFGVTLFLQNQKSESDVNKLKKMLNESLYDKIMLLLKEILKSKTEILKMEDFDMILNKYLNSQDFTSNLNSKINYYLSLIDIENVKKIGFKNRFEYQDFLIKKLVLFLKEKKENIEDYQYNIINNIDYSVLVGEINWFKKVWGLNWEKIDELKKLLKVNGMIIHEKVLIKYMARKNSLLSIKEINFLKERYGYVKEMDEVFFIKITKEALFNIKVNSKTLNLVPNLNLFLKDIENNKNKDKMIDIINILISLSKKSMGVLKDLMGYNEKLDRDLLIIYLKSDMFFEVVKKYKDQIYKHGLEHLMYYLALNLNVKKNNEVQKNYQYTEYVRSVSENKYHKNILNEILNESFRNKEFWDIYFLNNRSQNLWDEIEEKLDKVVNSEKLLNKQKSSLYKIKKVIERLDLTNFPEDLLCAKGLPIHFGIEREKLRRNLITKEEYIQCFEKMLNSGLKSEDCDIYIDNDNNIIKEIWYSYPNIIKNVQKKMATILLEEDSNNIEVLMNVLENYKNLNIMELNSMFQINSNNEKVFKQNKTFNKVWVKNYKNKNFNSMSENWMENMRCLVMKEVLIEDNEKELNLEVNKNSVKKVKKW